MDAINTLKKGISPGIDNILSELIKHGGNYVVNILTFIFQKTKHSQHNGLNHLRYPISKKGNFKKYQNFRTLSLICHSSKFLLKIIFKRLNPQMGQIL